MKKSFRSRPKSLGIRVFLAILIWAICPLCLNAKVIALAGDSTVANVGGWGGAISDFLPNHTIVNQAVGGRSTKSFILDGNWQKTLDVNADYVFIQFGHNDMKLDDFTRGAYPVDNPPGVTVGPLDLYRDNLRRMINDVEEIGATPVLLTPVAVRAKPYTDALKQIERNTWKSGAPDSFGNRYSFLDYADAVKAVGVEENVAVIDLNWLSLELYGELIGDGMDVSLLGPPGDNSHFNESGGVAIAEVVAEASLVLLVPEPSSVSLSVIGFLVFGTLRGRRKLLA